MSSRKENIFIVPASPEATFTVTPQGVYSERSDGNKVVSTYVCGELRLISKNDDGSFLFRLTDRNGVMKTARLSPRDAHRHFTRTNANSIFEGLGLNVGSSRSAKISLQRYLCDAMGKNS